LTANLRRHAIRCFSEDAVKIAMSVKDAEAHSGSILLPLLVKDSNRFKTLTARSLTLKFGEF
jgi:hypothetical protein